MRDKDIKYYYFAFESIFDAVFDSQVVEFVKEFNKGSDDDKKITLVVFGSLSDLINKEYGKKRCSIIKALDGKCHFFFKFPYFYRFPCLLGFSVFLNAVTVCKALVLFLRLKRSGKMVFHCRTEMASYILLKIRRIFFKKAKMICDCRGVGSKEILYKYPGKKGNILSNKIRNIEDFAHNNSDLLFCVSESFKRFIQGNNQKHLDIEVIPCCINTVKFKFDAEARDKKRKEMGIDDRFVVLYSGSLNEWQLPEEMINIFKVFQKNIEDSIFVLFTRDMGFAEDLIARSGLKSGSYIIESKSFDEIGGYLQVGDMGLLIREENDVNRVAFPIKFTEYVRSGVPVLTSITSDVAGLISRYNAGFILMDHNDQKEIERTVLKIRSGIDQIKSNGYKEKISSLIGEEISWEKHISIVKEAYKGITDG